MVKPMNAGTALFLLFFVSLFNYMDRFVLSVLLPSIKTDLQFSDTMLGAATTAFTISYVVFGIPLARLADRYSRKHIIGGALAVWSLMTAACGLAQNFVQLAVARALVGVGEAGATPPAHSIIADLFPVASRSRAIAVFSIGAPVADTLSRVTSRVPVLIFTPEPVPPMLTSLIVSVPTEDSVSAVINMG